MTRATLSELPNGEKAIVGAESDASNRALLWKAQDRPAGHGVEQLRHLIAAPVATRRPSGLSAVTRTTLACVRHATSEPPPTSNVRAMPRAGFHVRMSAC